MGCGIGRHIVYLVENGFNVIGLDLSKTAISKAILYLNFKKISKKKYKLLNSSSDNIDLPKNSIQYIISHGTLDSMPTKQIKGTVNEIYRVLKKNGLCYVDLMSDKVKRKGRFVNNYDQKISENHEKNTFQSYFNLKRIKKIFKNFKIIEIIKDTKMKSNNIVDERFLCVVKKID